jgi:hypothetical protein
MDPVVQEGAGAAGGEATGSAATVVVQVGAGVAGSEVLPQS